MIHLALCAAMLLGADDKLSNVSELGPVRVITTLTPREPTIGDEVVLEIRVQAAKGVDVLMPEFGEALSRYTILDFVPRQKVADDGSTLHTQKYTLQPYLSGSQSIPPILVEFVDHRPGKQPAPEDLDAYEILTDRINFEVKSVLPDDASDELNPPLGKLELEASPTRSMWIWIVAGSVLVLVGAVAGIVIWVTCRKTVLRRNAYEIARARLNWLLARSAPQDEQQMELFFVEISAIIRRYLEDRFDLRAPELTTEEFLAVAGRSGALSQDHQKLLREFLKQADLVKFAGLKADEKDLRLSTELAIKFLEETRENAPMIDVTDQVGPSANESIAEVPPAGLSQTKEGANV